MKNKIYKLLSIVLTVMLIFSCCSVGITALAEEVEIAATYYISATGSDETGTGTSGAPFLSVAAAINQATTDGNNVAGKTIAIMASNTASDTSVNMWGGKAVPSFDCNIQLIGDTAKTPVLPTTSLNMAGKGSITFKNITLYPVQYGTIFFANKDIHIGTGCSITANGGILATALSATGTSVAGVQKIDMESAGGALYLAAPTYTASFAHRFDITFDVPSATQTFYLGCPRSADDGTFTTTYKDALNFNIKDATKVNITLTPESHGRL